jgi:mannose-1-phosphate guanylyltransferase/mannose-1-phosphate guanylyltransferase/phosphomannomutase
VISGDALTDIDLGALLAAHRERGALATVAARRVADTREYGVVLHDQLGAVTGFQEKPEPEDALSDLGNCGIYCLEPAIFDYFPQRPFVDWAQDVFPALLAGGAPFYVHQIEDYWNDVGSLAELRQGTFDALAGELRIEIAGSELAPGVIVGDGSRIDHLESLEGTIWIGRDVAIGAGVRLRGPLVIGDSSIIGEGAALRDTIVFPGTEVAPRAILIGAIAGHFGIAASLRPRAR